MNGEDVVRFLIDDSSQHVLVCFLRQRVHCVKVDLTQLGLISVSTARSNG